VPKRQRFDRRRDAPHVTMMYYRLSMQTRKLGRNGRCR
jgi:hypothetical protein